MLEPKLAILDETDSGLDIDAVKAVAEAVNQFRSPERSFIVVTHYERILNYVTPDHVHVLAGGKVVMSGDMQLALDLEAKGYDWITNGVAVG
jgi:Fe-S cluster assembly ATP-binding protein